MDVILFWVIFGAVVSLALGLLACAISAYATVYARAEARDARARFQTLMSVVKDVAEGAEPDPEAQAEWFESMAEAVAPVMADALLKRLDGRTGGLAGQDPFGGILSLARSMGGGGGDPNASGGNQKVASPAGAPPPGFYPGRR